MGDQIRIQPGSLPWQPSRESELVATLPYYDMPLAGLIVQNGGTHAFRCLEGQSEPTTLWVYARVTDDEAAAIQGAEDVDGAVEAVLKGRHLVLTIATDADGIVSALLASPTDDPETLLDAAVLTFRQDLERLQGLAAAR